MTAPELKPCPFCGETAQETLMVEHLEGTIIHPAYRVRCDNCGASTGYSDRGDHITEWNTRAAPAALAVPEVASWMPIETAPKDGLIDIWLSKGVRWCDCYYDRICDEWRTSRPSGRLVRIGAADVSYWMPRPAPPTTALRGEGRG